MHHNYILSMDKLERSLGTSSSHLWNFLRAKQHFIRIPCKLRDDGGGVFENRDDVNTFAEIFSHQTVHSLSSTISDSIHSSLPHFIPSTTEDELLEVMAKLPNKYMTRDDLLPVWYDILGLRPLGSYFIFQQDNDPKHVSNLCKDYSQYLEANDSIEVIEWHTLSPDLNPIEFLWEELDRDVQKEVPTTEVARSMTPGNTCYLDKTHCRNDAKTKGGNIGESQV
ncbi:hypothetical protein Trydic_g13760 [Trypoxylus dichotomus]